MTMVKRNDEGEYYVCRRTKGHKSLKHPSRNIFKYWFRGYISSDVGGSHINVGCIYLPRELEGKKFRLKLEVIENEK